MKRSDIMRQAHELRYGKPAPALGLSLTRVARLPDEERWLAMGRLMDEPEAWDCLVWGAIELDRFERKKPRGRPPKKNGKATDYTRAKMIADMEAGLRKDYPDAPFTVRSLIEYFMKLELRLTVDSNQLFPATTDFASLEQSVSRGRKLLAARKTR